MPIRPENRRCDWCGTEFVPYRGRKDIRWCSLPCKKRSASAAPRQVAKQCVYCGISFLPTKSAKQSYCSSKCKNAQYTAMVRADPTRAAHKKEVQSDYTKTLAYRVTQRSAKARRRAAVRAGSITVSDWNATVIKYGNRCAYCGAFGPLTMDHVVPLARGGAHCAANVVPACRRCNSAKGTADWSERLVDQCP